MTQVVFESNFLKVIKKEENVPLLKTEYFQETAEIKDISD